MVESVDFPAPEAVAPNTKVMRSTNSAKGTPIHPKAGSLGIHAVVIKESEHLGPQAYKADDAGITAFQTQNHSYAWAAEKPPGTLEGRAAQGGTDLYVLFYHENGEAWIKFIQADWTSMQSQIEIERSELKRKFYQRQIEVRFKEMVQEIIEARDKAVQNIEQDIVSKGRLKKLSVLTKASDDFLAGSSGEKETDEKSPSDLISN